MGLHSFIQARVEASAWQLQNTPLNLLCRLKIEFTEQLFDEIVVFNAAAMFMSNT